MNTRMLSTLAVAVAIGCFALAPAFAQDAMSAGNSSSMSQEAIHKGEMHKDAMMKSTMHKDSMMMKKDAMKHHATWKHDHMKKHGHMMKKGSMDAMKKDAKKMKKDAAMGHGG